MRPAPATDRAAVAPVRAGPRAASSYTDLAAAVRASGLMERRRAYYWGHIAACLAALGVLGAAMVVLGDSWWQLLVAAALGLVTVQLGFLGHDAAHRQVFVSGPWNEWTARVLSGLFAGLSYGWWRGKHNRHHATPNQEGLDPDIGPGALAFTPDIASRRTTGARGWFLRHQGWLFFPLLTLEGLNLHAAGVRLLLGREPVRHRWVELALIATRFTVYVGALLVLLPLGKAVAFFLVQVAVFGVGLGASFAPSHKGMPIVPPGTRLDFLRRQVLVSRNVRGGLLVDAMMGGLNYQIEHHLFPSMPRANLKHAQPLVRAHCERLGVPYVEVGLLESYGIVVDYLNNVGIRARGPFECPLATRLRG